MAQASYRGGLNFQQANKARRLHAAGHEIKAIARAMLVSVECVESHVGLKQKRKSPAKKPKKVASSVPKQDPPQGRDSDDDSEHPPPVLGGGETIPGEQNNEG